MTLKEQYPLGNMKGLRALILAESEKRRAQLRAEVKEMQMAKVGSPILAISVEEHRKAIRNHIQRSLIKQVKAGRYSFCMEFDAAPQDEVGNPCDESGNYLKRAEFAKDLLAENLVECWLRDKQGHAILVVAL